MHHKGPRYKTGSFTFWFRLCLKLHLSFSSRLELRYDYDLYGSLGLAVDLHGDLVRTE